MRNYFVLLKLYAIVLIKRASAYIFSENKINNPPHFKASTFRDNRVSVVSPTVATACSSIKGCREVS